MLPVHCLQHVDVAGLVVARLPLRALRLLCATCVLARGACVDAWHCRLALRAWQQYRSSRAYRARVVASVVRKLAPFVDPALADRLGEATHLRSLNAAIGWHHSEAHRAAWTDSFSVDEVYWSGREIRFIERAWGVRLADFRLSNGGLSLGH